MADYNERLSRLHQRVVQDVLGISATIDDDGDIEFRDADLGEVKIPLHEYNPEYMGLRSRIFADYNDLRNARKRESLVGLCNEVNYKIFFGQNLARLIVHNEHCVVYGSVALVVAAPEEMPERAFLGAALGLAMSSLKAAAREFAAEFHKVDGFGMVQS